MSARTNFLYCEGHLFSYEERNAAGKTVSVLRLRIPSSVKGKDSTFINVESWELDDVVRKQLNDNAGKGRVVVQGELRQDSWNDKKTGERRSKLFVAARHVSFQGPWKDEEEAVKTAVAPVENKQETKVPF